MDWLFWNNEPSKEDMMLAMLDAQGKIISGMVEEIKSLSAMIENLQDKKIKPLEVPPTLHVAPTDNLWEKNVLDENLLFPIDDICHETIDEFLTGITGKLSITGECYIEEDDEKTSYSDSE